MGRCEKRAKITIMYRIIIAPEARKGLKTIARIYQEGVSEALQALKEDPFLGKPLSRELAGRYSYKVGVYRIIYKIYTREKLINIISAGHRATIYN